MHSLFAAHTLVDLYQSSAHIVLSLTPSVRLIHLVCVAGLSHVAQDGTDGSDYDFREKIMSSTLHSHTLLLLAYNGVMGDVIRCLVAVGACCLDPAVC